MNVTVICRQISEARWKDSGGGVNPGLVAAAESELKMKLDMLGDKYTVTDVKVNHFIVQNHNNGGCNEVWVQYTILYK